MNVDLLGYREKLKIKKDSEETYIWDKLRKKYLVLTPEEMVRQLCLEYLIDAGNYPKEKFNAEKSLKIDGRIFRYDLLLFDPSLTPFLLVECKAPSVKLSNLTFEQISNYNRELKVPYLLITNGPNMYLVQIDWESKKFTFQERLPDYPL